MKSTESKTVAEVLQAHRSVRTGDPVYVSCEVCRVAWPCPVVMEAAFISMPPA